MTMKVYAYKNCDSCRKAKKWLKENGVAFEEIAIREQPPTKAELKQMMEAKGGELKSLFNTSGGDYRSLGLKDRLSELSFDEAADLLMSNGNLVKRPFVVGRELALVGFKPEVWTEAFGL
ncbi:MAG: arsenate reductase family protein [Verrucomicrobiales bacterium]